MEKIAWLDVDAMVWMTSQKSLFGGFEPYDDKWPRSGMMENAVIYYLPTLVELTSGIWPTPVGSEASKCPSYSLSRAVNPSLQFSFRKRELGKSWPTPRASEWKGTGPLGSKSHNHRLEKGYLDATVQEEEQATGKLSPLWVEWLMGFPPGWTDISEEEDHDQNG